MSPFAFVPEDLDKEYHTQEWVWRNRIPKRKVTIVSGDWGSGKTHAIMSVLTSIFKGEEFPDGEVPEEDAGRVLVLTTESSKGELSHMLIAQGCDEYEVERVKVISFMVDMATGERTAFDIDHHMSVLESQLKQWKPILLIMDPLVEFHSRNEVNSHQIRGLMVKLDSLCQKWNLAILALMHWNKNEKLSRANRNAGSHQYQAGVKSFITVERDAKDHNLRHFRQDKMTLGPEPVGLAFTIDAPDGFVSWQKVTSTTASPKLQDAKDWILQSCKTPQAVQELMKVSPFAERTLKRARNALGLEIVTREIYTGGHMVSHWEVANENNLWGAISLSTSPPGSSV